MGFGGYTHWVVILTVLVLTAISTFLTVVQGWSVPLAYMTVAGVAVAMMLIVLAISYLLAGQKDRADLTAVIMKTVRQDLADLFENFRKK